MRSCQVRMQPKLRLQTIETGTPYDRSCRDLEKKPVDVGKPIDSIAVDRMTLRNQTSLFVPVSERLARYPKNVSRLADLEVFSS